MNVGKYIYLIFLISFFAACTNEPEEDIDSEEGIFNFYFDRIPDLGSCYEGILKDTRKQEALSYVNYVRSLHNLSPVSYDNTSDLQTQKAAFMSVANQTITHTPSVNSKCYSPEGADGCLASNLSFAGHSGFYPDHTDEYVIEGFMKEKNSPSIGHRRWILFPFLKCISYGRAFGKPEGSEFYLSASALKVIYSETQDVNVSSIPFIAYPHNNYPSKLFETDCFLSFSVVFDKSKMWTNVGFAFANIEVRNESNQSMPVSEKSYDIDGSGMPNSIQWKVAHLVKGVLYTVSIKNVDVEGIKKDFQYNFKLID